MQQPRRRVWIRIFVVRYGLPCDPPVGGHSCNGEMIPRFHHPPRDEASRHRLAWLKDPFGADGHQPFAEREVMERQARSLRLDARELDHLAPFLGFGCNESAELGGAKNHWDGADIAEPRPDVRRSQPGIDLAVEPFDDLHWRAGGRAEPDPGPRLVSSRRPTE